MRRTGLIPTTRREFLYGASAAAAGVAGASLLPSFGAKADEPKSGGTLRFGTSQGATSDSLDPGLFSNGFSWTLDWMTRNNLTEVDAAGNVVPELAESWEPDKEAETWTFKLRKGVEFHSGKSLDADDVVASLNYHRGEKSTSAVKPLLDVVADISAADKQTVVFKLDNPNADLPYVLSSQSLSIRPAANGSIDPQTKDGTGGYVLDQYDPGASSLSSRFKNYWKAGRAHFDAVQIVRIPDSASRASALQTGQVDFIDTPQLSTLSMMKSVPGVKVESVAGRRHYTFPMMCDADPFKDVNLRMALKYAVDRKDMVDRILFGYGSVGNDQPIAKTTKYSPTDLPQREYDPDKAKWHLDKAGLKSLSVKLSTSDAAFDGAVTCASLYAEQAKKSGIDIEVVREPADSYWTGVWMQRPWCMVFWDGQPTVDAQLSLTYQGGAPWNDAHWKNDKFDGLLVQARSELDDAKRAALYHDALSILRDDSGTVIPVFADNVFVSTDKLAHGPIASNYDVDGFRFIERWWFS